MGRILEISAEHPQPYLVKQAVEVLRSGGIIAHPTDTTYALAVAMSNKKGVDELYRIKKKDLTRPLSFLCSDISNLSEYALINDVAFMMMRKVLPGAYTIILPAKKNAPKNTIWSKRKEIGLRVPDDNVVQALIDELGEPLISTSAKEPGGDLMALPHDIQDVFGYSVELILDVGWIEPAPSTIISFLNEEPEIIREGKGTLEPLYG